jgi:hypothetical protein
LFFFEFHKEYYETEKCLSESRQTPIGILIFRNIPKRFTFYAMAGDNLL